ncbi:MULTISPECIES: FxDxF family PEP-CTERM protein [Denitromonas]|uniref:PEP-CTERM sorting domain-containing protein n=2 Tax=Denitromonas TaxID=139331 RepID=A0A557QXI6_9RHOO|nr:MULTISPECIES: FxDxF family PEP-CTERM protein [Denitromonas]TVO57628.1 PEP-CTERM sorting domain-containing protein [Denitromonas halophila]TVO68097.1 PEP-CTERM sorting domain-containing protein [Denitromonas ohlonensis]TVO77998.1 PEP-CTERM sorting domain-containing protein [Denitromonas ohlonensis]
MKIKFLVLAVFSVLAAPAMAVNSVIDLSSGSAAGAQTHVAAPGSSFVDHYFFSLSQPVVGGLGASDIELSYVVGPTMVGFDIGGLTASLWADLGTVGSFDAGVDSQITTFGSGEQLSGSFQLAAGNYFFQVGGTTIGATGGVYSWAASVSPVPEPEQYGMLLAGLGLIGLIARRRVGR